MAVMEIAVRTAPRRGIVSPPRVRPARSGRSLQHGRRSSPGWTPVARPVRQPETAKPVSDRASSRALLHEYHRHGDLEARDQLIRQYLPLVKRLARSHAGRGEQVEDLVQVGSIGLINAIDRYDLDRGVELSAYAIPSIVGEIKRHLRDRAWPIRIPRRLQELNASLHASAYELAAKLERPATVVEMASEAGVDQEEALEALAAVRSHKPLSLSAGANGNGEGGELDASAEIERGYEAGEDRALLARGFRALDERERRLLHLAFFEGMSQARIACEVGISQIHVSRLTRRALEKLRAEIGPS
jgi:RNA polymerase sigma-B factor